MDDVLLVFAKVPRPGHVKTRLTPALTPSEAAELYEAFLRDALELYATLEVDVRLYLAPPLPDDDRFDLPARVTVHEQTGEGLGERMARAFRAALAGGYDRASVVGTDHPTLPLAYVRRSFRALAADRSVCIGPSDDGGFYLLGMSAFYPQLFDGMTYSHADVFDDTLARVDRTDARLTVLPRWYDVDTPEALSRMIGDLAASGVEAPRTRRAVERLALRDRLDDGSR
jgi:hypothetical protein